MNKLNRLIQRRNKVIKEYRELALSNMDKKIESDHVELRMLEEWGELNEQVIQLRANTKYEL